MIKIGKSKLLKSFEKVFPNNESHVVPLSGGYDSRAILACLLEFTEAKNIQTYTFGTPCTYDYDIGNLIAKKVGTSHLRLPLNAYTYTHDEMIETSLLNEHATHLFHHPPSRLIEKHFNGCYTWVGFMGGSLPGSGLQQHSSETLNEATMKFFKKNTYVQSINLVPDEYKNFQEYLDVPDFNQCQLTLDEQLNFFNRQKKYTYYHVKLLGKKILYPFLEKEWSNFILSLENKYRVNKNFYERMLYVAFPILFKLKVKNKGGVPLYPGISKILTRKFRFRIRQSIRNYFPESKYGVSMWTNYIDFNSHIRHNKNFNRLIYESVNDLRERNIMEDINIQEVYDNHMKRYNNHADALLVLASLEYHLKSGLVPN